MSVVPRLPVWPAREPGGEATHFWYCALDGVYERLCDQAEWPPGKDLVSDQTADYVGCEVCCSLYVLGIVKGGDRLVVVLDAGDAAGATG